MASLVFAQEKVVVIPLNTNSSNTSAIANAGVMNNCSIVMAPAEFISFCDFDPVPAGKILVVEFISGSMKLQTGQTGEVAITITPSGSSKIGSQNLYFRFQQALSGFGRHIVSQPVRMYIDEGSKLGVSFTRPTGTGTATGSFWFTG